MIRLLTIIGARPQIIKAAALSRAIHDKFNGKIQEIIVHTGQHYDNNMSKIFFEEMEIPAFKYNLNTGSGTHGKQTAMMLAKIEEVIILEKPDYVVLFGDTNSTLSGSIAAAKQHYPIIHIEAGLRSYQKSMPEEINRIVCDHTSTLLFAPTKTAINNLIKEGFHLHNTAPYSSDNPGVFHSGDIMLDNTIYFSKKAEAISTVLQTWKLVKNSYILATIHRENNTDQPERLNTLFEALNEISSGEKITIVLPLHPRTVKLLSSHLNANLYQSLSSNPFLKIIPPASFFDTIILEKYCKMIFTDSGGIQKEAYYHKKPVLILRSETEWPEIIENKSGILTDANAQNIYKGYEYYKDIKDLNYPPVFGEGKSADYICNTILTA